MYRSALRIASSTVYNVTNQCTASTFLPRSGLSVSYPFFNASQTRCNSIAPASLNLGIGLRNAKQEFLQHEDPQDAAYEATSLVNSLARKGPEAWIAAIDSYLPGSLRSGSGDVSRQTLENQELFPIHTLPSLLSASRATTPLKLDILSYLGVHEGRWNSVIWLIKELLKGLEDDRHGIIRTQRSPWETDMAMSQSLGDLCRDYIKFKIQAPSSQPIRSLDNTTEEFTKSLSRRSRGKLGQVYISTASMILQATDLPTEHPKHKTIMSNVLKILAYLHHIDALPKTIYSYSHAKDPSVVRKPPTLYLLAYRVMTILSDSAWRAYDEEIRKEALSVGAKDWYKGHEIDGPTLQPRINMLGPEAWLDLVLWCCVEGGWIAEAAWIVREMAKRKGNLRWKTIDWASIREPPEPKLNWSARVELEIARSRMNQIASGIAIAGQSGAPPFVEMGPHTISQEVILALMDALSNTISPTSLSNNPTTTVRSLSACRTVLNRSSFNYEESLLNRSILSVIESGMIDPHISPGDLERILELAPSHMARTRSQGTSPKSADSARPYAEETSVACIGMLHKAIYLFASQDNLQGALRCFRKMQSLVDNNRRRYILEFADDLKRRELEGDPGDELVSESINNLIPGVHSQMPAPILASLLDLVTQTGQYEIGEWFLYSDEVDGPLIPPSLYSEVALQPALLRFAEATENGKLFNNISANLQAPLPPDILRVLLRCQITLRKWDAAQEIFAHFQSDPDIGLVAEDIMAVAKAVLRLDHISSQQGLAVSETDSNSLNRARSLLQETLQGKYSPVRDPSTFRDYSHFRVLTQIGRILHSIPGTMAQMPLHTFGDVGRANATESIPTGAFNILLEGIVDAHGSLQGRKTWDFWCRPIREDAEQPRNMQPASENPEHVVDPSLQTLRIVVRPIVRAGKFCNDEEAEIVSWAVDKCQRFGLTPKEIGQELPGLISDTRKAPVNQ